MTTATIDTPEIASRALLVSVSVSTWAARRFDKKVTDKVNKEHGATKDAGRYSKHLFGGKDHSKSHSAAVNAAGTARSVHYKHTLPWTDDGWRLLPTANYDAYRTAMNEVRAVFDKAVVEFIAEYPQMRDDAPAHLNGLHRPEDYPPVDAVASKFRLTVDFGPVPLANDFRLTLPQDQMEEVTRSAVLRVQHGTKIAMQDAWGRLHEIVSRAQERFEDDRPITRKRLFNSLEETVDVLKRLNVTGDPDLEKLRKRVEMELATFDPRAIRDSAGTRQEAAEKAAEIVEAMSAFYTPPEG